MVCGSAQALEGWQQQQQQQQGKKREIQQLEWRSPAYLPVFWLPLPRLPTHAVIRGPSWPCPWTFLAGVLQKLFLLDQTSPPQIPIKGSKYFL